jgi:hypothetical protein
LVACIVAVPIGCAALWWVTWPERTARTFAALMREGHGPEAERLKAPGGEWPIFLGSGDWCFACGIEFEPRVIKDVLRARQSFYSPLLDNFDFVAERGVVYGTRRQFRRE